MTTTMDTYTRMVLDTIAKKVGADIELLRSMASSICITKENYWLFKKVIRAMTELMHAELVASNGTRIETDIDPIVRENDALAFMALISTSPWVCICGGGQCHPTITRTCYEGDIVDIYGRYVCQVDWSTQGFYRYIYAYGGQPDNVTDVVIGSAVVFYDRAVKRLVYQAEIIPRQNAIVNGLGLGVQPANPQAGTCCSTCPAGSVGVSARPHIIVFYFPITQTTLYAATRYLVRIYFDLQV